MKKTPSDGVVDSVISENNHYRILFHRVFDTPLVLKKDCWAILSGTSK